MRNQKPPLPTRFTLSTDHEPRKPSSSAGRMISYLVLSGVGMGLLTLLLVTISTFHPLTAALVYIVPIVISATTVGRWPGLFCALLAFLAINFFFVPPYGTLWVASFEDALRLGIFLGVALVVGELASRAQDRAVAARERAIQLNALYTLSQAVSAEVDLARILPTISTMTCTLLPIAHCRIVLVDAPPTAGEPLPLAAEPAPTATPPLAAVATRETVIAIVGSDQRPLAEIVLTQPHDQPALTHAEQETLHTIALQTALVIERARLVREAARAQTLAESDRLKTALLASVSHDLRTPLAVIKGAVSGLLDESIHLSTQDRTELCTSIEAETDRLYRLVSDLLEMSQIETGGLPHNTTLHDPGETIRTIVAQLRPRLAPHPMLLALPDDLPLVDVHHSHLERILTNLIENAALYTPPTAPIEITAHADAAALWVAVMDRGAGIPLALRDRIFEKFVRGIGPERHAHGSGLGLAICKGLVEAHGGRIWIEDRPGGGAAFYFTLPLHGGTKVYDATATANR